MAIVVHVFTAWCVYAAVTMKRSMTTTLPTRLLVIATIQTMSGEYIFCVALICSSLPIVAVIMVSHAHL